MRFSGLELLLALVCASLLWLIRALPLLAQPAVRGRGARLLRRGALLRVGSRSRAGGLASLWLVLLPFAEEPWLREKLGVRHEAYAARVPRYLGLGPQRRERPRSG